MEDGIAEQMDERVFYGFQEPDVDFRVLALDFIINRFLLFTRPIFET